MKSVIIFSIIFTFQCLVNQSYAQVPDDINGRLWRLAKVWGFAKYYHPNNCDIDWNDLLLTTLYSVLVSTTNENFNQIILDFLDAAGPVPVATEPLEIAADINLNAHFEWFDDPQFTGPVQNKLDSIIDNFRPRASCIISINDFTNSQYTSWIDFRNDNIGIPSFSYTNETHRLLVYFYYWNSINYFHADKHLMDQPWDTTLLQFMPLFREIKTEKDFHLRLINLATYLDDSHGFTSSPLTIAFFGTHYPLIKLDFIENETVITKVSNQTPDISVGDIVRKVNGIEISFLRDSLSEYVAASNDAVRMLNIHRRMLRGQNNSLISLELEDASGETYTTTVTRNSLGSDYFDWLVTDNTPIYSITDCGYGYVDMGELTVGHVPLMYSYLKNTPAIIFDIRNYPNGTLWSLIPLFYQFPMTWALLTDPDPTFPGWYFWTDNIYHAGVFSNPEAYTGKVIILANAETQSQAEYTVMGLQQHGRAFTIGSQTSGADGNISYLDLPGGLRTYWTSLGIFYPDSTTAQRVGIRIDSIVMPAIEDIREGRDAVLLAALDCLTGATNEAPVLSEINIYPNPANDIFYLSLEAQTERKIEVEAFDPLGQLVFQRTTFVSNQNSIAIDAALWLNGIYFITIRDEDGLFQNKKIHIQH